MKWRIYIKNRNISELIYDSELGDESCILASPRLKLELSKAGALDFTILPSHPAYNRLHRMTTYVTVLMDDEEIFRGRVYQIDDSLYRERHVQCEGDLSYLIDSLQPPQQSTESNTRTTETKSSVSIFSQFGNHFKPGSKNYQLKTDFKVDSLVLGDIVNTSSALAAQFSSYITRHNNQVDAEKRFTVGNITVTASGNMDFDSSGYRDTMSAIDSDLLKQFGGYLITRKNENGPTYIDWLKEPGVAASQQIVLSVNMVDMQQQSKADEIFTILVPVGDSDLTIATVNNGRIEIEDTAGIARFGRIYKSESYSGISDPAKLMELGRAYMEANYKPDKVTFTIKAIDMHILDGSVEAIHVGSTVTIVSEPHDIQTALTCISVEYDMQDPGNNSYEIGDPSEPLSQKTKSDKAAAAQATKAAGRSAGRANAAANDLEKVINEHAKSISYTADELFKVEADVAQIHAKCIEITASETVKVTCDEFLVNATGSILMKSGGTFDMEANGTFTVKAGGKISMESGTCINFNNTVYIGNNDLPSIGTLGNITMIASNAHFDSIECGTECRAAKFMDEVPAIWENGALKDFTSMEARQFHYINPGGGGGYLEDAVSSFGSGSVDGNGVVSIPYYTFSGDGEGTITFDMAATAFFKNSMAAEYDRGYNNGYNKGKNDGASAFHGPYSGGPITLYEEDNGNYYSAGRHNWYYK